MSKSKTPQRLTISPFDFRDIPPSCTFVIIGPPGSGKCLGKGTPILMYDGSLKNVEDVKIGDNLMGDDNKPRAVLSTTKGVDVMYKIRQSHGDEYIVNSAHLLCLKRIYEPVIVPKSHGTGYTINMMKDNREVYIDCESYEHAEQIFSTMKENVHYTTENILEIKASVYFDIVRESTMMPKPSPKYLELMKYKGYKAKDVEFPAGTASVADRYEFIEKLIQNTISNNLASSDHEHCEIVVKNESHARRIKLICDSLGYHTTIEQYVDVRVGYTENELKTEDVYSGGSEWKSSLLETVELGSTKVTAKAGSLYFNAYLIKLYGDVTKFSFGLPETESIASSSSNPVVVSNSQHLSDIEVIELKPDEYFGFEITGNRRFLLGDCTVTHNTTLIENVMYILKDRYPVGRAFIGTEGAYKRFCEIMPPLFVSNRYDEEEEKSHIIRQKTCDMENGKSHPSNYAINVLDDVSDDPRIYKTPTMRGLFKLGSQHWHQLLMVGSQYAIDMPPDVRKSVSYVAIFMEPEDQERRKLYANFGGLAGSYEVFCELMNQLTGDYTCLIFRKRTQTQNLEENVFYFKTFLPPKKWEFGCKEYRQWGKERYDKDYVELLM